MPKISDLSSYGQDASITGDEYLIGTDVGGTTKTFTLTSIAEYVESTLTVATGGLGETNQSIPTGATRIVDIGVSGSLIFQYNSLARITLNSAATVFASGAQVQWLDAPSSGFDLTNRDYVDGEITTLGSSKQNTLISGTNIKTVNSVSILGSGNVDIPNTNLSNSDITVSSLDRNLTITGGLDFILDGGTFSIEDTINGAVMMSVVDGDYITFDNIAPRTTTTPTLDFEIPNKKYVDDNFQPTLVSGTNIKTINGNSLLGSGNIVISTGGGGGAWSDPVDSNIVPNTDNTYDLGTNLLRFGTVYSSSLNTTIATAPYLRLTGVSTPANTGAGYIYYDSDDDRVKLHNGTSYNNLLQASDIIDDDTFATATASNIASSESIKTYIDAVAVGGVSSLNQRKIDNSRKFYIQYHTSLQTIDSVDSYFIYQTANDENKGIINSVEGTNNVDYLLEDIGDIGDPLIIDNDGSGVVRLIASSTETFIGEGQSGETFSASENTAIIPQNSRLTAVKKKANTWRLDGIYTTTTLDIDAPTVTSTTVQNADPDALVVVFDREVNITNVTGLSLNGDWTGITINSITSGSGTNTLTFALSGSILNGETGSFVYGGTNTITNLFGIALVASSTSVTNNVGAGFLYDSANAINPDNEANATIDITPTNCTISSVTTSPQNGTYSLEVTVTSTGSFSLLADLPNVINGQTVNAQWYIIKQSVTSDFNVFPALNISEGWNASDNDALWSGTLTTWTPTSVFTQTATQDNPKVRLIDGTGTAGDIFRIDNLIIS